MTAQQAVYQRFLVAGHLLGKLAESVAAQGEGAGIDRASLAMYRLHAMPARVIIAHGSQCPQVKLYGMVRQQKAPATIGERVPEEGFGEVNYSL